jgi:hypothetical protein
MVNRGLEPHHTYSFAAGAPPGPALPLTASPITTAMAVKVSIVGDSLVLGTGDSLHGNVAGTHFASQSSLKIKNR